MPTLPPIPSDQWDQHVETTSQERYAADLASIDQARAAQQQVEAHRVANDARDEQGAQQRARSQIEAIGIAQSRNQEEIDAQRRAAAQIDAIRAPEMPRAPAMPQGTAPPSQVNATSAGSTDVGATDWRAYAAQAAQRAGIDPALFQRQIQQESNFDPNARSGAGAQGIAQIVPSAHPGVNPLDPKAALDYAATWMRQLTDRYGGDARKALAAYNAGPGAVDKYGGVPPFEETQRYVKTIHDDAGAPSGGGMAPSATPGPPTTPGQDAARSGAARAPSRAEAVGQFEQGLPAEDAYSICGPVAALAFAQANGRNPDLAEARALAKQVGWTTTGGMNGVQNEQALLTRMGVKSNLDTNPDVGRIAQDAASGNPVIISTPVHYYFINGVDEATGRLHVGKTGEARKGGGSWMTPQEIATLDGGINGALFVDNPQSPTPSVGADPMAAGPEGDRPASEFTPPDQTAPDRYLGPRVDQPITPADVGQPDQPVMRPDLARVSRGAPSPTDVLAATDVPNRVGFAAAHALLTGGDPAQAILSTAREGGQQPTGETLLADAGMPAGEARRVAGKYLDAGLDWRNVVPGLAGGGGLSAGRTLVAEPLGAVLGSEGGGALGQAVGGDTGRQVGETLGGIAGAGVAGAGYQRIAENPATQRLGIVAGGGNRGAQPAERAAMPAVDQILKQWDPGARPGGPGVAQRLEAARTFLVRKLTDRRVDLNQLQNEVTKLVGGTLPPEMQVSELSRMNPTGAATLRVQNDVAPAIRAAGADLPYVDALLAARGNVDVAAVKGQGRAFSGGATAASSADVPVQLEQTLGPRRFKTISDAADRIVQVNRDLRQMLVDSGRITQQTANEWARDYPNYTPVQVVDYLAEQSGLPRAGQGKSLGVQAPGIHTLSGPGTERGRLEPIASTVNNVYAVEALAKQQATFNALHQWVTQVPEMAQRFQVVDGAYSGTRAENAVRGYVGGKLTSIVTPFPEMARVLRQDPQQTIPLIGPIMQAVKELITARNPAFLVGNAMMDFPVYLVRETARAGGMPADTARAVGRYAAAIPDAFSGLLSGEFTGAATQRYLAQGGSMDAWAQKVRSPADAARYVQELRRSGGIHIASVGDLMTASKALLTGQTFKTIGERVELVPRVAAFRAGEQAGLSPARAVARGRDVTVDFAEGGTWAKNLNQLIPFFNPAVQGGANLARTIYQNPRGAGMTFALGLVAPTLAIEAWNNADPERAAAYADVPNYVKDRGVVFMLPGPGGRGVLATQDAQGNRKPQYLALNLREFAPVVAATRAAGDVAFGREHRSWSDLLLGAAQQVAPTADIGSATPLGARSLLELGVNKDLYRGTAIATQNADERASILSKALAQGINDVAVKGGAYPNVRPSQVEFLQRENLGVLAQASGGVSDVLTGATAGSTNPQDIPVAGAFLRRVVGNATGQGLEDAREGRLDPDVRRTLYDTGLAADVTTVPRDIKGIPLLQADQTAYQTRANQHVNESLRRVLDDPTFASLPPDVKRRVVQNVVQGAKQVAAGETLAAIGGDEVRRRSAAARKAG